MKTRKYSAPAVKGLRAQPVEYQTLIVCHVVHGHAIQYYILIINLM